MKKIKMKDLRETISDSVLKGVEAGIMTGYKAGVAVGTDETLRVVFDAIESVWSDKRLIKKGLKDARALKLEVIRRSRAKLNEIKAKKEQG